MTKKQRNYFFLGSIVSVFVMAVAVLFGTGKMTLLKASFARASGSEYSISFNRDDTYSADDSHALYKYKKQTPLGNDVYMISSSENGMSRGTTTGISAIPGSSSVFDSSVLRLYLDSSGTNEMFLQNLVSVTVKTSTTVSIAVQTSGDGISYKTKYVITCNSGGATCSGFTELDRYLQITENVRNSSSCYITGVSLTYECQSTIAEPTFMSTYCTTVIGDNDSASHNVVMHFNNDGFGRLEFGNTNPPFYVNYKWEKVNAYKVKITYYGTPDAGTQYYPTKSSGAVSDYQGYCLFIRFNSAGKFINYISVFEDKIGLVFHTETKSIDSSARDTYYKYFQRTQYTYLDAE